MSTPLRLAQAALSLMLVTALPADEAPRAAENHILYLMQKGYLADAVDMYHHHTQEIGRSDFELLHQMGLLLLELGFNSGDPETQLLSVYGAGISAHDGAAHLIEKGLYSKEPQIQLVSLDLLARLGTDWADQAINRAIASELLLIRFTAIHHLAQKKHPAAVGQIEALMHKVPKELWVLFPPLFAAVGDARSTKQLRRLLNDADENVRLSAILSICERGRDDLLPQIRNLASQPHARQQEACAMALGKLRDQSSIPKLRKLANDKSPEVRLAASQALWRLGQQDARQQIENMAKEGNLFAIFALGEIEGSEDLLAVLGNNASGNVRLNATLALLQRRDARALKGLQEILIRDSRDLAFVRTTSKGLAMPAWKAIPSATHNLEAVPAAIALSVGLREDVLSETIDLPDEAFFQVADMVLAHQQNDLIPTLIPLLENSGNSTAIKLLKNYQQKVGAPLVRNYCCLALFRLGEDGPYEQKLHDWIADQQHVDMIRFRPFVPLELRTDDTHYELTPEESSRLFIAAVEALATSRNETGVDVLLDVIRDGNAKNKYALAGLLIRATQ